MKFLFFSQSSVPFHGKSLAERPMGGIETSVILLAEALQALGHDVIVLTNHPEPPLTSPLYVPIRAYETVEKVDVLIAVRDWTPALLPIPAKIRLYWSGDSYDQQQNLGMGDLRVAEQIDAFLAVSDWQAGRLCEESGFPPDKIWVIRNGIKLSNFAGSELRQRKRLIYSSTPYRGLQLLPVIYREILSRHADAQLHIFSSYDVYAGTPPPPPEALRELEVLKAQFAQFPNCVFHGSVRQHDLAREFMRSSVLAYPNTFEETSCITAMEAQAAGCAVLTSRLAALPETVGNAGILVDGRPGSTEYLSGFLFALDRLLADDALFTQLSQNGRQRAQEFDWSTVAGRLLGFIEQRLAAA